MGKKFSKSYIHIYLTILIIVVIVAAVYKTKEAFSFHRNSPEYKQAKGLVSKMGLPDTVLDSVPTLMKQLKFSSLKENFYGMGDNTVNLFASPKDVTNTSKWDNPNLGYSKGQMSSGASNILNRPPQPIPLPEGQLDMFANTSFKPECCPNAYSNSTGCACMTVPQYNYLIDRGGNNVPYSEY